MNDMSKKYDQNEFYLDFLSFYLSQEDMVFLRIVGAIALICPYIYQLLKICVTGTVSVFIVVWVVLSSPLLWYIFFYPTVCGRFYQIKSDGLYEYSPKQIFLKKYIWSELSDIQQSEKRYGYKSLVCVFGKKKIQLNYDSTLEKKINRFAFDAGNGSLQKNKMNQYVTFDYVRMGAIVFYSLIVIGVLLVYCLH